MFKQTAGFIVIFSTLFITSGCTWSKPVDLSYLKEAEEFRRLSGIPFPRYLPRYLPPPPADTSTSAGMLEQPGEAGSGFKVTVKPLTAGEAGRLYTEAVRIYKLNGTYFQLINCQGAPGTMSLKQGVKFMIDNRDNTAREVGFNNQLYKLDAYGFVILAAPRLPLKYYITCDGGGTALLNVES